jgi:hypothetical protein
VNDKEGHTDPENQETLSTFHKKMNGAPLRSLLVSDEEEHLPVLHPSFLNSVELNST